MSIKKYAVTANCRVECTVTVEASSLEEAKNLARETFETNDISNWNFPDDESMELTSWSVDGGDTEYF